MKRIIYSCFLILTFCFTGKLSAQAFSTSVTPHVQCFNSSNSYSVTAGVNLHPNTCNSYTWIIQSPSLTCPASFSDAPIAIGGTPSHSVVNVSFTCCGVYTITCYAYNGSILLDSDVQYIEIVCPTGAGISATPSVVCIGTNATFVGTGGTTYTWSNGSNANPLTFSPSVNTCLTFTATNTYTSVNGPIGCTLTPGASACVSVQAITGTITPASQTMCAGSPVSFTAAHSVPINGSVTPGTTFSNYYWLAPPLPGTPFGGTGPTATNNAVGGQYSVGIVHNGAAGTCTAFATASVIIGTSIPVTLTSSSPDASLCPNQCFTLMATSVQTAATSYTWSQSPGFPTIIGNTGTLTAGSVHLSRCPGPGLPPARVYTVDVDYFGCPGKATYTVNLRTLTPTITSSSGPSTCPGKSLTLTATGGLTYTFSATPSGTSPSIPALPNPTPSTAVHTPSASQLPIQYCVTTASAGCTGSACIIVVGRTLTPILSASSPSMCPGTEFTLTSTTNGASTSSVATYTFVEGFSSPPGTITSTLAPGNKAAYTPPVGSPFPHTYTVIVDSAGCTGMDSIKVYLLTLRTKLTPITPSICAGKQTTISASGGAGTTYTFFASHPQFTTSATSTTIDAGTTQTVIHTPPTVTVVHYTVATDSMGCKGMDVDSIGILDLGPTMSLIPSSYSICPGTAISFTALGAMNYTFVSPPPASTSFSMVSVPNNTSVATATDPAAPNPLGPFKVYTLKGDSGGCVGTKTLAIYERTLQPQLIITPTLVCSGQPVSICTNTVGSNTPLTNYTFVAALPLPARTLTNSPFTASCTIDNPTAQTVYFAVVDSAGCKGITPSMTVDIRPDLLLIPSASSTVVCPGMATSLSVVGPPAATSIQFTWTQAAGSGSMFPTNPATVPNITVNPVINTTYTVTAIDSLGCVGDTIINIAVDPLISFSIAMASSGTTICPNQTASLTANTNATATTIGTITYSWTPPTGMLTPTAGAMVIVSPSITTLYTVSADNGYGCPASNTILVPVGVIPIGLTYTATSPAVCPGFTSTLTAFGANSYSWTTSTSTVPIVQQSISVGPGNYTLVGSNGGSCTFTNTSASVGSLVPANALPISIAMSTPTTCVASNYPKFSHPVTFTASGASTYAWFPNNNLSYTIGPITAASPVSSTQYTVIGSSAVCSNTQVVTVTVIPQFSITVTPPLPAMCKGDSLKLSITNVGQPAVGPISAYTYSWTEALNAPPISISSYFTPTVSVYPQNTTTYSVEVLDSRQCMSLPRLITVTVLPRPVTAIAIPTINSVPTNTVCFVGKDPGATDVTINLTGVNMNPGLQFGVVPTYTWVSPYPPAYNSILTPPNNNAVIVSAPIRELNNSSVVVYTLISGYNGVPGCFRQDTVSIRVVDCRPVRAIKFTTSEPVDTICTRTCVTYVNLTDTMAGGPQKLKWTFQGGSPATSTLNTPLVCYNFPGAYNVILEVSNPYPVINPSGGPPGSTLTIGKISFLSVVDIPNVTVVSPGQLRSDTTIRFGQTVDLTAKGAIRYNWAPPYNISSVTGTNVSVTPHKSTQYILTGYNSKYCKSYDTLNVYVKDESCGEMYVPNAFTPNGDGANDVLYVRGICLETMSFMIFNRWGEKVFETADQKNGWDGTYKGQDLNTGVFVYRLEGKTYDGKSYESKGNITLIR